MQYIDFPFAMRIEELVAVGSTSNHGEIYILRFIRHKAECALRLFCNLLSNLYSCVFVSLLIAVFFFCGSSVFIAIDSRPRFPLFFFFFSIPED